tara:strand:- start:34 stop:4518 length:4485 start_codon:yes stop_codon:yes gene_type:complete
MKKITALFFLILSINCFSQFSKTHYIPPLSGSSNVTAEEQFIYISTPSSTPVNFKIIQLGGTIITGIVSQSSPYIFNAGYGNDTQLHVKESLISTVLKNKGYVIEAEDVVYVTVRVIAGNGNQAGALVSKGLAALGTQFRIGAFTNTDISSVSTNHLTFISILATENNTLIKFSGIKTGVSLINNGGGAAPANVTLNSGESYVLAVKGPNNANRDGLIGSLVSSDKPIAINCGSYAGTNGDILQNVDLGFDQIVSAERTGKDYILIKSTGQDSVERVLIVANEDNTEVYLNGNLSPSKVLNAGEYVALNGSNYSAAGNLYIRTSKNTFIYQSVGDNSRSDQANQELFFVPPLSCETPKLIDNIPNLNQIGSRSFTGRVTIVTEKNATLTFAINGTAFSLSNLPATVDGPKLVTGNSNYETYTITGLSGNVSAYSSGQLYLASYGSDGAATYGGFYSGFTFKPQITFDKINIAQTGCVSNTRLFVSEITGFDTFQWYYNNVAIPGATTNKLFPNQPGYYHVKATIASCGTTLESDKIPVSDCPLDTDNDLVNNNIDIDLDNDGILNRDEANISIINQSNPTTSTDFNAVISGNGTITGKPIYGFVSEVPAGKTNNTSYTINLTRPQSLSIYYIAQDNSSQTTAVSEYLNSEGDFIIRVPSDKTITLSDPQNQLLVDTNFDGIYESGITTFSSFEIRFRLKSTTPLLPGTGSFTFLAYLTNSITFIHKNLSETNINKATFMISHTETYDTDSDGIPDLLDLDSDNDGIPDTIEAQGKGFKIYSGIDDNNNGLDNAFEPGINKINTDNDLFDSIIKKYDVIDLDSDNDGIYDLIESGSGAPDTNNDGIIDGPPSSFGNNGLYDNLETNPDSGILKNPIADTDNDGNFNYIDLDSDDDSCFDVTEAGFTDNNKDGILGNIPVTINAFGIVTSRNDGYTLPNNNYLLSAPISINEQPKSQSECELQETSFTILTNAVTTYQWQVSIDGTTWNDISNNSVYSGITTNKITINSITNNMNGYSYRVLLSKVGNSCGLISNAAILTVFPLPKMVTPIKLIQCDDDLDGFTTFNITEQKSSISTNYSNETFTYYTSFNGANTKDHLVEIVNPIAYRSNNATIWTRVENANGCFSISQINLIVSSTQIPTTFSRTFETCDDYIDSTHDDMDGVSTFDFSSTTLDIKAILPSPSTLYAIKYYNNESDALSELNEITNISNYRNTNSPYLEYIWVRVESTLDNYCYGLGPHIKLKVNAKPNINTNENHNDDALVCSNLSSFFVKLNAGIQDGSSTENYTYVWSKDNQVLAGNTAYTLEVNEIGNYSVMVINATGCSRIRTINVTASDLAHIETISILDLAENNTITVNVTGQGSYEYSLDAISGPFQSSNFFDNVSAGIHEVFINDTNGCGTIQKTIAIIGVPKFFTPNGDGFNDYWNLKGVNTNLNSKSLIYIFDRYGKLLKQLNPNSIGWDGTFNGLPLPADDYWYTIKLEDSREVTGHFSIKR